MGLLAFLLGPSRILLWLLLTPIRLPMQLVVIGWWHVKLFMMALPSLVRIMHLGISISVSIFVLLFTIGFKKVAEDPDVQNKFLRGIGMLQPLLCAGRHLAVPYTYWGQIPEQALSSSWRRFALKYHPDKSDGSTTAVFQCVSEGMSILKDDPEGAVARTWMTVSPLMQLPPLLQILLVYTLLCMFAAFWRPSALYPFFVKRRGRGGYGDKKNS